jgi:uncharacterized membrane protein
MTGAHIHLLLNHFPITGGLVALALLAYGWLSRNNTALRAACVLFVVLALFAVATYLSGEPAEHVLERQAGFAEDLVEPHEEAAIYALVTYCLLGLLALYTVLRYARREVPRGLATALLLLSLVSVAAAARVGWLGGPITHQELRAGGVQPAPAEQEEQPD